MLWKRALIEHHEVWKDYTTENAIVVTKKKKKKPHNPWKSQTINSCLKNCSGVVHAFSGFGTESAKKIMKETVDIAWKGGRGEESQNMDLGNIQELADPTAEELTE